MGNRLELLLLPNRTNGFLYPLNPSSVRKTGPKVNHKQRPSPYMRMNQELEAAEGTHITQPISPDGCRRQFLACTVLSRVSLSWKAKAENKWQWLLEPNQELSFALGGGKALGYSCMVRSQQRTSLLLACLGLNHILSFHSNSPELGE